MYVSTTSNYSVLSTVSSSSRLSRLPTIVRTAGADVDIDTSGNGKAVPLMVKMVCVQMERAFAILLIMLLEESFISV